MKTWTELCNEPCRWKDKYGKDIYRFINEQDYKQIQLDAMKEGMRRAAEICKGRITESDLTIEATRCMQKILSAAEQLTEKDL